MIGSSTSVGAAIAAALDRAEQLRSHGDRPARVRIMTIFGDDRSGLTIHASIRSNTPAELRAQQGLGVRCIPWDELDARAGEIVGLVDAVVGEVTLAVKNAPQTHRPSRSKSDVEMDKFGSLIDHLGRTLTHSVMAVLRDSQIPKVPSDVGSEATMVAALKLAALAAFTANIGANDAQDELRLAIGDVMSKASASPELSGRPPLNS
ncbi:MAG: hypothetical protein B7Y12_05335 [Rhizobiales bacterium 24-66-13]|nr:MAG: hypothetical protein B7Y12_05335 [Rhizobiales bacterium 24-66-13]OZB12014.1 MAG: hypothetical protein B7X67_01080 [Rhizobiales bacterium 39-66-18]HQS46678.1 hypothetical protein [Xanthobacteraceae bacterium]